MSSNDLQHINEHGRRFVYRLGVLMRTALIHQTGNKALDFSLTAAVNAGNELFKRAGPFELMGEGHLVHLNGLRLRLDRAMVRPVTQLTETLRQHGVGGLGVSARLNPGALRQAIGALLASPEVPEGRDPWEVSFAAHINEAMPGLGLQWRPALRLRSGTVGGEAGGEGDSVKVEASRAVNLYIRAIKATDIMRLYGGRDGVPRGVSRVVQQLVELAYDEPRFFLALTGLKQPGVEYHLRHQVHVMILSIALARRVGLSRGVMLDLGLSALTANLSMFGLPKSILEKPGPLDEPEWAVVRRHPLESAQVVLGAPSLDLSTRRRVRSALESDLSLDGGGYPKLQKPREPHLFARIIRVCQTYDAITTDVPWRTALLPDEALEEMTGEAGLALDSALFAEFVNLLGRYPLGTVLLLDTGEIGVVYIPPADAAARNRPVVKLLTDADGDRVQETRLVDLQEKGADGAWARNVRRSVKPEDLGIDLARALYG
ncbi:MAG: hypothetical protein H6741_12260 [Alphaproteobacteria bacterium]|nr:hypothetical protein [Alphaproteobacteria bacterium]MCB9793487.1 hypothetical protein [Alphaproteobacteria bacterium]